MHWRSAVKEKNIAGTACFFPVVGSSWTLIYLAAIGRWGAAVCVLIAIEDFSWRARKGIQPQIAANPRRLKIVSAIPDINNMGYKFLFDKFIPNAFPGDDTETPQLHHYTKCRRII